MKTYLTLDANWKFIAISASDAAEYGLKCINAIEQGWTIETCIMYAIMAFRSAKMAEEFGND